MWHKTEMEAPRRGWGDVAPFEDDEVDPGLFECVGESETNDAAAGDDDSESSFVSHNWKSIKFCRRCRKSVNGRTISCSIEIVGCMIEFSSRSERMIGFPIISHCRN